MEVVDEGLAEVLPVVDVVDWQPFEPREPDFVHHDREVWLSGRSCHGQSGRRWSTDLGLDLGVGAPIILVHGCRFEVL